MRESTYVYKCDFIVAGKPCDITSLPQLDYYTMPDDWSTVQIKSATYHLCLNHTDVMAEEIIVNRKAYEEAVNWAKTRM